MFGDPYARLIAVIRNESTELTSTGETSMAGLGARPAKMRLGTVLQRAPLKLRVMGVEQPTEVFYINERLTKGAAWKAKITSPGSDYRGLTGSVTGNVHSTDTVIDNATVEQMEIDLNVDDQVLLLTEDDQVFYIVMKVVKAV